MGNQEPREGRWCSWFYLDGRVEDTDVHTLVSVHGHKSGHKNVEPARDQTWGPVLVHRNNNSDLEPHFVCTLLDTLDCR